MPCPTTIRHHTPIRIRTLPDVGILLASAALVTALSAPLAQAAEAPRRTLQLSATGEITAVPDMAIVTLGMETQAKTAKAALAANTRAMRRIFDRLKGQWQVDERDMVTTGFSVSPVYVAEKQADGTIRHRLNGYRVTNMLTVRIRRLEDLGAVLDSVVSAGSNRVQGISFTFSDPEKLREAALRKAVQKAVRKARLMAKEAGFTLGPILSMHENASRPLPPVPAFRRTLMAKAEGMPVPVARGEGKVSVSVSVTWEIR